MACARRENPADRRSSLVEPTAAGRDAVARGDAIVETVLAETLKGAADLDDLGRLLAALRARVDGGR